MKKLAFRGAVASTVLTVLTGIACFILMGMKAAIDTEAAPERFDSLMRAYYWGIRLQNAVLVLLIITVCLWLAALILRLKKT